ncbi:MAG TPA: hypothetical protein EYQ74_06365 [Planctomycetes bacterium]|nr:hypothetical protein [Planctomycetota bacterium]HIK60993.1 hypothetical protein [Planctomycetota bacterium]
MTSLQPFARLLLALAVSVPVGAQAHVADLTHSAVGAGDGFALAMAIEGSDAVVAAPYKGPKYRGRAWVFDAISGAARYVLSPSTSNPNDTFGLAVAVHDGLAAVSANTDHNGQNAGSVFLFDLQSGKELFEFRAWDGEAGDLFGQCMALGPGRLVVAAPGASAGAKDCGALYVFDTQTGKELKKIVAKKPRPGMRLGMRLDLDGQHVVASANWDKPYPGRGTVYVFNLFGGKQMHKLDAQNGQAGDSFGASLAADGGRVLIGAPSSDQGPTEDLGKAYVFDLTTGAELMYLPPPANIAENDRFGTAVALADGLLLVSAPGADAAGLDIGSVHLLDSQTGAPLGEFARFGLQDGDRFGTRLAASGSRTLVGMPFADPAGVDSGEGHLFCLLRDLGQPYCGPGNPNSTGLPALMGAYGADDVACGQFQLAASQLPPARPALALASQTMGWVPFMGGGQGNLCLGGNIGRFRMDVGYTDPDGTFFVPLELDNLPQPLPPRVVPGDTWYFQLWFRDKNPTSTSNLTTGLRVQFR